jgi:enoyl-CoA hydratase
VADKKPLTTTDEENPMSDEVLVDVADGIMTVTLNRPEAKNAANKALADGVAAAMDELDSNDDIAVAILTGAGGTFCSGMDLKAFVTGEMPVVEGRGFAGLSEYAPRKPLIAAVEGYALAGGLELAISCDLIVTADNAKFGIPEAKRGLAAAAGGLVKLPRQIPPRLAMELALTGDFVSAQRAYDMGLVNQVVPAGTALDAAKAMAAKIAANGPLAVAVSKQVILESADWNSDEMWKKQQEIVNHVFTSADAIEGSVAFAEKRAPNWTGK